MDLSLDVMAAFKQSPASQTLADNASGLDLNVHVLTSGFWPSYPIMESILPDEINAAQSIFKDFYLSKHSGRKLVWYNSLGTCLIRANFDCGARELSVSLLQVLYVNEERQVVSFFRLIMSRINK